MTRHGTEGGRRSGCVCGECVAAATRAQKRRRAGLAGMVPSGPSREMVVRLQGMGWSLRDIQAASGVGVQTLSAILRGQERVRMSVHRRLLEARYERRKQLGTADPVGTRRRIQALCAIGHSFADQSRMMGMRPWSLGDLASGRSVPTVRTVEKVADLFDRISGTPGSSMHAVMKARRLGWAPPLAWDDIDDPHAKPSGLLAG